MALILVICTFTQTVVFAQEAESTEDNSSTSESTTATTDVDESTTNKDDKGRGSEAA